MQLGRGGCCGWGEGGCAEKGQQVMVGFEAGWIGHGVVRVLQVHGNYLIHVQGGGRRSAELIFSVGL